MLGLQDRMFRWAPICSQTRIVAVRIYVASKIVANRELSIAAGSKIKRIDLAELEKNNRLNVQALRAIAGSAEHHYLANELRVLGRHWAQHVLEIPRAWMLSALYIFITVVYGSAPMTSATKAGMQGRFFEEDSSRLLVSRLGLCSVRTYQLLTTTTC